MGGISSYKYCNWDSYPFGGALNPSLFSGEGGKGGVLLNSIIEICGFTS